MLADVTLVRQFVFRRCRAAPYSTQKLLEKAQTLPIIYMSESGLSFFANLDGVIQSVHSSTNID